MEVVGGYELHELIGRGATGSVWRAFRPGPVRQSVAIKRATCAVAGPAIGRLQDEADILAELDHPHIVRILDVLVDDGDEVAIVMSMARGGSLHDLLAERGMLSAGQVVAVTAPVAEALDSAHRRGVLHGDVKPSNILFTSGGEPMLADFGAARYLQACHAGAGELAGTAPYIDPELLAGAEPDPCNDVYAVAVVAYLALTGRLPHGGGSIDALLDAADRGEHLSLLDDHSVPRALAAVIESGLARQPEQRPTAKDLARSLRSAVPLSTIDLPGVVPPDRRGADPGGVHRTQRFGPRPLPAPKQPVALGRRAIAVGAVAVVALGISGVLLIHGRRSGTDGPAPVTAGGHRERPRTCSDLPSIPLPPGGSRLHADLERGGCPVPVVWDGAVIQFRLTPQDRVPRRFDFKQILGNVSIRHRGGRLLIGDWDCDGVDSPALYNPGTGIVHYFGAVPALVGAELAADREEPTGVERGLAEVRPGTKGRCDEVVVAPSA